MRLSFPFATLLSALTFIHFLHTFPSCLLFSSLFPISFRRLAHRQEISRHSHSFLLPFSSSPGLSASSSLASAGIFNPRCSGASVFASTP